MVFGDEWPRKHDLSSLRVLGTVGEPINPEAWLWYYEGQWTTSNRPYVAMLGCLATDTGETPEMFRLECYYFMTVISKRRIVCKIHVLIQCAVKLLDSCFSSLIFFFSQLWATSSVLLWTRGGRRKQEDTC